MKFSFFFLHGGRQVKSLNNLENVFLSEIVFQN